MVLECILSASNDGTIKTSERQDSTQLQNKKNKDGSFWPSFEFDAEKRTYHPIKIWFPIKIWSAPIKRTHYCHDNREKKITGKGKAFQCHSSEQNKTGWSVIAFSLSNGGLGWKWESGWVFLISFSPAFFPISGNLSYPFRADRITLHSFFLFLNCAVRVITTASWQIKPR